MINHEYLDLFNESSVKKDIDIVYDTNKHITNSDVVSGSFSLNESAFATQELRFGSLVASELSIKLFNTIPNLMDKELDVNIVLNDTVYNPLKIGKYKVLEDKPTTDRLYKQIKAYDGLYEVINTDYSAWYESLTFPMTLKTFRDSFFIHIGITQVAGSLVNDAMQVEKTITSNFISGQQILSAICELNGAIGRINRDGNFVYVVLKAKPTTRITIDKIQSKSGSYEDYVAQPISKVQIRQTIDDIGAIVGNDGNTYIVQDNFLVYGKSSTDLNSIASKLLSVIKDISYTPFNIKAIYGNPCYEIGDAITVVTKNKTFNSYIFNRTLKGIQAMTDTIKADGVEYYTENLNGPNVQIQQLKRQTNELSRTVEETKSTITSIEDNLDITSSSTGSFITVTDSGEQPLIELYGYGKSEQKSYTGKNKINNVAVSRTVNGITVTVNADKSVTVNGTATAVVNNRLADNIEAKVGDILTGCPSGGAISKYELQLYSDETRAIGRDYGEGAILEKEGVVTAYIIIREGVTVNNLTFYPMLRDGNVTDSTYEPYTGGVSPNPSYPQAITSVADDGDLVIKSYNKNYLNNIATSRTVSGIEFVVNVDKSVTAKAGTATATIDFRVANDLNIEVGDVLSGCPSGGGLSRYELQLYSSESQRAIGRDYGDGRLLEIEGTATAYIIIREGVTIPDLTFYPMVRKAGKGDNTYVPHNSTTATIPLTESLRGIKVSEGGNYTDATGQQWICDTLEKYADGSGKLIKRVGNVDISTLNWAYGANRFQCWFIHAKNLGAKMLSTSYIQVEHTNPMATMPNYSIKRGVNSDDYTLYLRNDDYTDVTTFKSAMSGVMLCYELAEPIETPLTAEQLAEIEKLSMFNPITHVTTDDIGDISIQYYRNTDMAGVLIQGNEQVLSKAQSSISQTADAIKLEVSKTYTTKSELEDSIQNIQDQIDGALGSYSGSEVPTLNNYPANTWTTTALKDAAIGSLYFVNSEGGEFAGFSYRWEKLSNGTYQWALLKDTEVTQALKELEDLKKNLADNYSTTAEMNSAINVSAQNITSSVSATYATKTQLNSVSNLATTANQTANSAYNGVSGLNTRLVTAESTIKQQADQIELRVKTEDYTGEEIASLINQTAENIKIIAKHISLEGLTTVNGKTKFNTDGSIEATDGKFSGTITSSNAEISGGNINLKASKGDEGRLTISYGDYINRLSPSMFELLHQNKASLYLSNYNGSPILSLYNSNGENSTLVSADLIRGPRLMLSLNGTAIRLIRSGTTVLTGAGNDARELLTLATIRGWYSGASNLNTAVFICNGDGIVAGFHPQGASWQSDKQSWYAVFDRNIPTTQNIRINWMVICW